MTITTVGIDIAKRWFHLIGCNEAGRPVLRKKVDRAHLLRTVANIPVCVIGMEACAGSQHLAREFQKLGHQVRLVNARFVKAYLKSGKNDFNDAEAIAEAVTRPTMRFVPYKTVEQLDIQAVHRVRDRLIAERTAAINQIRAFLMECGVCVSQGRVAIRDALPAILEDAGNELSGRMRELLARMRQHWIGLEDEIGALTGQIEAISRTDEDCQRLETVPGIGSIGATAIVAAVGNASAFARGRDLAAWLGLVPRQYSSGGKSNLLGIRKRGNGYIRKVLIHGARSLVNNLRRERHAMGTWITGLEKRVHRNVLVVALANKLARIAWAILARKQDYRPGIAAAL